MHDTGKARINEIFSRLAGTVPPSEKGGLAVVSPADGAILAQLPTDAKAGVDKKIALAREAQKKWAALTRAERAAILETLAAAIKEHRDALAEIITLEAGKTNKEGLVEADGSADTIIKTLHDAGLPELLGMLRTKERPPVGVVGLITSFNFPLVVAYWTLAPALLAGNGVVWKPSEKTPLVALALKIIFDEAMGAHAGLLQIIVGGRDAGEALVAHENVDMISATGSVAMGKGIRATLAKKKNNDVKPILELGGNNGVILSEHMSPEHLAWSLHAILNSFFGTSGQRCTNTRRLIVHKKIHAQAVTILGKQLGDFIASGVIQSPLAGASNEYGYGPLIDEDAYNRFENAKKKAVAEGGEILFGKRILEKEFPGAYYVEPALALMPKQSAIMHEEVFAPLLFIAPYAGDIEEAIALLNAPANAGLVGGIYTQSQREADAFAAQNQAGHSLINSPKGTGTPAFGMGFGGNKDSGVGEILNPADPLRPFTRDTHFTRVAQNKDIIMSS